MRRREVIGGSAIGALGTALGLKWDSVSEQTWVTVPCPGCQLPVAFLARQRVNRCGHCKTAVVRGLV